MVLWLAFCLSQKYIVQLQLSLDITSSLIISERTWTQWLLKQRKSTYVQNTVEKIQSMHEGTASNFWCSTQKTENFILFFHTGLKMLQRSAAGGKYVWFWLGLILLLMTLGISITRKLPFRAYIPIAPKFGQELRKTGQQQIQINMMVICMINLVSDSVSQRLDNYMDKWFFQSRNGKDSLITFRLFTQ